MYRGGGGFYNRSANTYRHRTVGTMLAPIEAIKLISLCAICSFLAWNYFSVHYMKSATNSSGKGSFGTTVGGLRKIDPSAYYKLCRSDQGEKRNDCTDVVNKAIAEASTVCSGYLKNEAACLSKGSCSNESILADSCISSIVEARVNAWLEENNTSTSF